AQCFIVVGASIPSLMMIIYQNFSDPCSSIQLYMEQISQARDFCAALQFALSVLIYSLVSNRFKREVKGMLCWPCKKGDPNAVVPIAIPKPKLLELVRNGQINRQNWCFGMD